MRALPGIAASLLLAGLASAQTVSMSGSLGSKALLMIDGAPRTVAVGSAVQGVKLISVTTNDAMVEVDGKRFTLRLGAAQVSLERGGRATGSTRIVLSAGPGGHYMANGFINGKAAQFVVDTGATSVSISAADATRMGIKYLNSPATTAHTANGQVQAYVIKLDSVRVGEVQIQNVDAIVVPGHMSHVLLGNSFLSRFQMKSENQVMTLDRRF